MESKLKAYRRKKAREELLDRTQNRIKSIINQMFNADSKDEKEQSKDEKKQDDTVVNNVVDEKSDDVSISECDSLLADEDENEELCDANTWTKFTLYGSLWAVLFVLAVRAEFGAVYFVVSLLIVIWKNTRTAPRRAGEMSAYSVFNPNCEAIEGTLTAEQLQNQMLYGVLR